MKNSLYILVLLAFSVSSCGINDDKSSFLFSTNRYSNTADHVEMWVFVSDHSGKLLDLKKVEGENPLLEFEGVARGEIMVTQLSVATFQNGDTERKQYYLETYLGIPAGTEFRNSGEDQGYSGSGYPDYKGTAKLLLKNYDQSEDPWFSVGFGDSYSTFNNWLDYESREYDGINFSTELNLRESSTDMFVTTYNGNEPVYIWERDIQVGDSVVLDYNDFQSMNLIPINKPVINAYVQGQIEPHLGGRGYFLSWSDHWRNSEFYDPLQKISLGYVEGFDYYDVYISDGPILCCEESQRTEYHSLGPDVPAAINLPSVTFQLNDNAVSSFNYNFSRDFDYANAYFSYEEENEVINWSVSYSGDDRFKAPVIPAEIKAQLPFLKRTEIPLFGITFYENLDGYTYSRLIEDRFEMNAPRNVFERFSYHFTY